MTANPPQSRAPPGGPEAQGATSDQASCKLQIRSALSPPAGSGDPPSLPSTPTRLRAAAPLPEGPGPPCRGSPGAASSCPGAAPSLWLFQDKTRAGVVEPKVPSVLTRSLLVSSQGCQRDAHRSRLLRVSGLVLPGVGVEAHFAQAGQRSVWTPGQAPWPR